ncbi:hypothetical protein KocCE7_07270 [Kocuria marina subsp. indica]|nr:hypothetical protein KocCE7_07270 [Kocuria indica]
MAQHRKRKKREPARPRALCRDTGKQRYYDYGEAARVALRRSRSAGPLRIYKCGSSQFGV